MRFLLAVPVRAVLLSLGFGLGLSRGLDFSVSLGLFLG